MPIMPAFAPRTHAQKTVPQAQTSRIPASSIPVQRLYFGLSEIQKRRVLESLTEETLPALSRELREKAAHIRNGEPAPPLPEVSEVTGKNGAVITDQLVVITPSGQHYRLRVVPSEEFSHVPTSSKYTTEYSLYEMERIYPETATMRGKLRRLAHPREFPPFRISAYEYNTTVRHWIRPADPRQTAHYGTPMHHESGFRLSGIIPEIGAFDEQYGWEQSQLNRKMQAGLKELFKAAQDVTEARKEAERTEGPVPKVKL